MRRNGSWISLGSALLLAAGSAAGQQAVTIELDRPGEPRLRGYDITIAVTAGPTESAPFEAYAAGRDPLEGHGFGAASGHGAVFYLEVHPR